MMVKIFSSILLFLTILPLTFGLPYCSPRKHVKPMKHVKSTFDLNKQSDSIDSIYDLNYQVESYYSTIDFEYPIDSYNNLEQRLIQTGEDSSEDSYWMTEEEIMTLKKNNINFMDITDHWDLGTYNELYFKREYPLNPSFSDEVNPIIGNLTTKYMRENLEKFTSFHNRYYRSDYGVESSEWLFGHISDIIKYEGDENVVSVRKFSHNWKQNSIIARFEGYDSDKENEVVIVGAHQDSINMWWPQYGRAPGADDDGSGTVTILEAFRALASGGFKPQRPVEFHWYSAEEAGLLGSQDIASEYEKQGRDVIGMIQNDMTGYVGKQKEHFGIVNDFVDEGLTKFVTKLIESYADLPYSLTKCGYACSDHASWRKAGFPSAFAIEGDFSDSNPYIHSPNDVIDHLSFDHMLEFSKLSVSFAIELSHI